MVSSHISKKETADVKDQGMGWVGWLVGWLGWLVGWLVGWLLLEVVGSCWKLGVVFCCWELGVGSFWHFVLCGGQLKKAAWMVRFLRSMCFKKCSAESCI